MARRPGIWTAAAVLLATLAPAVRGAAPDTPTNLGITGGASPASQTLPARQGRFGLRVPLKPNAENVLTVTAQNATHGTATAGGIKIAQLSLTDIVLARVEARRLTVPEIKQLVAEGTIDVADPENFNVSIFDIVLTIGDRPVALSLPVSAPEATPDFATGPPITIGCSGGGGIQTTDRAILIPCGGGGGAPPDQPPVQVIPFVMEAPSAPGVPPIPGVIVIEGRIKTLKEFFEVKLILANVSALFTLSHLEARLEVPPGTLAPIAPASGPIMLDDLPPFTERSGAFVVRGDRIGIHTVTVHYSGLLSGLGIAEPIPVSGRASTDLEVKGPPPMDVKVSHPSFVRAGEPYTLTVEITNTSPDLPALFASLGLDVGADARILDEQTGLPRVGADERSLGDLLPGDRVVQSYRILPFKTGAIASCTAGASENLRLSIAFTQGGPPCAIGTYPSQPLDPSGRPTVRVVPVHNTTEVAPNGVVVAIFSAPMIAETVTSGFPQATFRLLGPDGRDVPSTLQLASNGQGNTLAILRPNGDLASNTTYTVAVSPDVYDVEGRQLASGLSGRFTTGTLTPLPDLQAPIAAIAVEPPVTRTSVPQGRVVQVRVDAADDLGLARIDLLLDGTFLDTRQPPSPARFLVDTTALAPGTTHTLRAVAFDGRGNQGTAETTITIASDAAPPTVELTTLPAVRRGRRLPAALRGTDDAGIARLELFVDGGAAPVLSGLGSPVVGGLETAALAVGPHTLRAVATDGAGRTAETSATVDVVDDTTPPVVSIGSPADGVELRRGVVLPVLASATDDTGVQAVELFLDAEVEPRGGVQGFALDTAVLAAGAHVVRARVEDAAGNVSEATAAFLLVDAPADLTPPAAPLASAIAVGLPVDGLAPVSGVPGAVEPGATVEIENLTSPARATVVAGPDGSFAATAVEAEGGNTLTVVAVDAAGNRGPATLRLVPLPLLLLSIAVTPDTVVLDPGTPQRQLAVTGTFSDGSVGPLPTPPAFASDAPLVAGVSAQGLVSPGQNGSTVVRVSAPGVTPVEVPVTVAFPTVVGVEVSPADVLLRDVGRMQALAVQAVRSDGSRVPFPGAVGFGSADPAIATVTTVGVVTGVEEGVTAVTVSAAGFAPVVVPVAVERARLVGLLVSPAAITFVGSGDARQLAVQGQFSDGSMRSVPTPAFASSDPSVATVDAAGLVTSGVDGDATIEVSLPGVTAVPVPVRVKSYQAISLSPPAATLIGPGKTQQLAVTAHFTDGSTGPLASGVGFASDDAATATVSGDGLVTSVAVGDATVTATFGLLQATATVQVIPRVATGIVVTPPSVLLESEGQTVTLAVSAQFNDGTLGPPVAPVAYFVQNANVATVSPAGVVTAVASGNTSINVLSGSAVASVPVAVSIPDLPGAPVIDYVDRERAGEGDAFTIHGRFFAPVPAGDTVMLGDVPAVVESARADQLVAIVPEGAVSGDVTVTTAQGTSNAVPLAVYARVAGSRLVTAAVDPPANPADVFTVPVAGVVHRGGDRLLLSSAPDVLAPLDFDGTLTVRVDGGAPIAIPPALEATELTDVVAPGTHDLVFELSPSGGPVRTSAIHLVAGPDGTGPVAGARSVVALGQSRPVPVTLTDLRYVDGTPVPDGAWVVASAVGSWVTPAGACCTSSHGGAVANGVPSPQGAGLSGFQVFGGRIDVIYDPAGAPPLPARSTATAIIAVLPAQPDLSRIGDRALALATVMLTSYDTAATPHAPSNLLADGQSKIGVVTFRDARDTAGMRVPDDAPLLVTPQGSWVTPQGACCTGSAGGDVVNGTGSHQGGGLRLFQVARPGVELQYDPAAVQLNAGATALARLSFLPSRPDGTRIGDRAFALQPFPLSSPVVNAARITADPASLLADTADNRSILTVTGIRDALGNPVPDGTRILATPIGSWVTPQGACCTSSAGGVIKNGTSSSQGLGMQCIDVQGGQAEIVYSAEGVALQSKQTATARIVLLPANGTTCNRIGDRAMAIVDVTLAGYGSLLGSISPSSAVADGLSKTVQVSLSGIRDAVGNVVPDGVKILATPVGSWVTPENACCTSSAGGTVTSGVGSPQGVGLRSHVVTGGQATVLYDPAPVLLQAFQTATALVGLLPSQPNDHRIGDRLFASVPIPLSSASVPAANVTAAPSSVLADFGDNRSIVAATGLRDAFGNPVPDGTRILMTPAGSWVSPEGACCTGSAGGEIVDGVGSPQGAGLRRFQVLAGAVSGTYSAAPLGNDALQTRTATIALLPGQGTNDDRIGDRALALSTVTLTGFAGATVEGPGQLAPGATATYTVSDLVDTLGNPIPDGAKVAVTPAGSWVAPNGGCCTGSGGGTVTDGEGSAQGSGLRVFTVSGGGFAFTFQAPGAPGTTTLALLPGDRRNTSRIGNRAFALKVVSVQQP